MGQPFAQPIKRPPLVGNTSGQSGFPEISFWNIADKEISWNSGLVHLASVLSTLASLSRLALPWAKNRAHKPYCTETTLLYCGTLVLDDAETPAL